MKLWYTMFILTFIILYGSLSVVLLGSWAYETARSLRGTPGSPVRGTGKSRA